jgi:hypothetical protein
VSEWQPIETLDHGSLKPGDMIWAVEPGVEMGLTVPHQMMAVWDEDKRYAVGGTWRDVTGTYDIRPTHWMPLPAPPVSRIRGEECSTTSATAADDSAP